MRVRTIEAPMLREIDLEAARIMWLSDKNAGERRRKPYSNLAGCAPSSIEKHPIRVRKHFNVSLPKTIAVKPRRPCEAIDIRSQALSSSSIDDRLIDMFVPYRQCIAGNTKHLSPICGCREISPRVFRRVPLVLSTRALKLLRVERKNVEWLQDTE